MEREYLERRIATERHLARRAQCEAAGAAHREMERLYAAQLARIAPQDSREGGATRIWRMISEVLLPAP